VVPTDHESNRSNIVLERHLEMNERRARWLTTVAALGKKGGVTHQLEHVQLAVEEIELRIRQAYKLYSRLKKTQADEITGSNNSLRPNPPTNKLQKSPCGRGSVQQKRSGTMQER